MRSLRILTPLPLLCALGCSLSLDWTAPLAPRSDAGGVDAPLDAAAADAPPSDDTPPSADAPPSDVAPDRSGGCSGRGEPCCSPLSTCDRGLVCAMLPGASGRTCEPCGGERMRCCALNLCGNNLVCSQRAGDATGLCYPCGGTNEQCCWPRDCDGSRRCDQRPGDPYPICR